MGKREDERLREGRQDKKKKKKKKNNIKKSKKKRKAKKKRQTSKHVKKGVLGEEGPNTVKLQKNWPYLSSPQNNTKNTSPKNSRRHFKNRHFTNMLSGFVSL